jgi:hypothetical protein
VIPSKSDPVPGNDGEESHDRRGIIECLHSLYNVHRDLEGLVSANAYSILSMSSRDRYIQAPLEYFAYAVSQL